MSFSINAGQQAEWKSLGLADFRDFSEKITECNVGDNGDSGFGQWFFVPEEPMPNGDRVFYFGSWGNYNSPGAWAYTNAEIFDGDDPADLAEFQTWVKHWKNQPEFVETDEDEDEDEEEEEEEEDEDD